MADHNKPVLTSTYTNFVSELDARFDDLAVGLDPAVTTATNVPTNALRWNSALNKDQKWNGTAWVDKTATEVFPTVQVNGYMGVGGAPVGANVGFSVTHSALTTNSQFGHYVDITGTSAATASIRAIYARANTAAAAFTTTDLYGLSVANAIKGAGSTITNQHGMLIADQTQGTNNYGITSQVTSGTNKWNIYASGTASNFFNGDLQIGTSEKALKWLSGNGIVEAPQSLFVRSTGAFPVIVQTNGSERLRIDSAGNVGIGTSSPQSKLHLSGATPASTTILQLGGDSTSTGVVLEFSGSANAFLWNKYNGYLSLGTNNTERLRIDSAGDLLLGRTSTSSYRAQITGATDLVDIVGTSVSAQFHNKTADVFMLGVASGDSIAFATGGNTVERMRIDSAGNLGLGVTPSAWRFTHKVLETPAGAVYDSGGSFGIAQNAYRNSSNSWIYRTTGAAAYYDTYGAGGHFWYTAPSGTAGNAITFTERMNLSSTGLAVTGALSATGKAGIGRVESATTGLIVRGLGTTSATRGFVVENGSGTEILIQDDAGNLGLGVTPSAWGTNRKALQIGGTVAALGLAAQYSEIAHNAISTVSGPQYATSNPAAIVDFNNATAGGFAWRIAPSGTAGNAITFTQAMTLASTGTLTLNSAAAITGLDLTGSGTNSRTMRATNTGGTLHVGIESSAGAQVFTGSSAYSGVVGTASATSLHLATNGVVRASITSAGVFSSTTPSTTDNSTTVATTAYARANDIGVDQTWQAVTRTSGTTYTNSTGKPIQVCASYGHPSAYVQTIATVAGVTVGTYYNITPGGAQIQSGSISFIVPAGATYSITSGGNQYAWSELR